MRARRSFDLCRAAGAISKVSGNTQDIFAQWLAALRLGAAHIEQTKFLHWEDLELILGPGVRYPTHQREKLQALAADPQLIQTLLGQSSLVGRRRGHKPLLRSPRQARHRRVSNPSVTFPSELMQHWVEDSTQRPLTLSAPCSEAAGLSG